MKNAIVILIGIMFVTSATYSQIPGAKVSHIDVFNISGYSLDVICQRTEVSVVSASVNYFCWDQCFIPSVSTSGIVTIGPGALSQNFIGDYNPSGSTGTSLIAYCFYDNNNMIDSACVIIMYGPNSPDDSLYASVNVGALVGVEDGPARISEIVDIYPNPASSNATVEYSLATGGSGSAFIVVRNLLGATVMDMQLRGSTGKAIFPVNSMKSGVYFYSLVVDGQIQSTQKLVVE
ncbi:MAG TPA: T9SS type A sorting domain-containing protein [Flavobacteriales bacterium]|nr:T9SS type A sorting domain-containing protein [Flavobacteriales bacterium]HIO73020.1 T9SS type A sorting domain-containing protein [Flavobacteriales bacterium]